MISAPKPPNEAERLAALRRYAVLDTAAERSFDRITTVATRVFDVPIALITLIDAERQWFKSCIGLDGTETSRDDAFCAHAILADDPLIIGDALEDRRFFDNPNVIGTPFVRFYAGAPLITSDGFRLGTLCIIDTKPRRIAAHEIATLVDLSAMVVDELELRSAARMRAMFERLAQMSPDLIYVFDLDLGRNFYNNRAPSAVLGYDPVEVGSEIAPWMFHPDDLPAVHEHFTRRDHVEPDARIELTCRVKDAAGAYRWFHSRETVFERDEQGRPLHRLGIATEITDLKEAQAKLENLATTDEMTGLPNYRRFRQRLCEFMAEGKRGRKFALALVDVDHFKRVNDVHGHQVGDAVLREVGRTLREHVRQVDFVARYGGEEFCVLFADVDSGIAVGLAERVRQAIAQCPAPVRVTASLGVCAYTPDFDTGDALTAAADAALYEAKAAGRNRVVQAK